MDRYPRVPKPIMMTATGATCCQRQHIETTNNNNSNKQRTGTSSGLLLCSALLALTYILTTLTHSAQAYLMTLDAGIENECFHEKVPVGTKLGFSFEVIEGGFYDVDVDIKDPANVILHQEERASNGKYTIEATSEGAYQFCFSNKRSSFAPKVIIFDIDKADPAKKDTTQTAELDPNSEQGKQASEVEKLTLMLDQLMLSTISARHDVRYLTARDKVHRRVNENTNRTIAWWSGLEFILLLGVTLGQVLYLKRFFEIRRKA